MAIHPALRTKAWQQIRSLMAEGKTFIIRNQYEETKWCSPNGAIYDINAMRGWFKFCYDIMTVVEVDTL